MYLAAPLWIAVVAVVLVLMYNTSNCIRYNMKMTFYYLLLMIISLVSIPYCMLRPGNARNHWLMAMCVDFLRPIFGIKVHVKGEEHLQQDGPFIIISNHQSSLDLLCMSRLWPDNCTSIAKRELMYAGPFGLLLWLMGTIFVNRQRSNDAKASLGNAVQRITEENLRVWIFPEGTRNHDNSTLLPFKKGAFHLAQEAKIAIIPVVIASYESFYCKREFRFAGGVMSVQCLPVIPVETVLSTGVSELSERTRGVMLEEYKRLRTTGGSNDTT